MECDAEDCGFQMLNDDEIVTSFKKNPTLWTMKRMKTRTTTTTKVARVHQMLTLFLVKDSNGMLLSKFDELFTVELNDMQSFSPNRKVVMKDFRTQESCTTYCEFLAQFAIFLRWSKHGHELTASELRVPVWVSSLNTPRVEDSYTLNLSWPKVFQLVWYGSSERWIASQASSSFNCGSKLRDPLTTALVLLLMTINQSKPIIYSIIFLLRYRCKRYCRRKMTKLGISSNPQDI
ncbi:uncharacterized protein TNCV_1976761 [Trichonephila clavipes]|nr:uncharacterized protein TNCV_1976761 [Trichonephila clavipes]